MLEGTLLGGGGCFLEMKGSKFLFLTRQIFFFCWTSFQGKTAHRKAGNEVIPASVINRQTCNAPKAETEAKPTSERPPFGCRSEQQALI